MEIENMALKSCDQFYVLTGKAKFLQFFTRLSSTHGSDFVCNVPVIANPTRNLRKRCKWEWFLASCESMQKCSAAFSPDVKLLRWRPMREMNEGKKLNPLTQQMLIKVAEHSLCWPRVSSCQEQISRLFCKQETLIVCAGMREARHVCEQQDVRCCCSGLTKWHHPIHFQGTKKNVTCVVFFVLYFCRSLGLRFYWLVQKPRRFPWRRVLERSPSARRCEVGYLRS